MSPALVAAPTPRAPAWAPSLAVAVLGGGFAAGVWKHVGIDLGKFCVLFAVAETFVGVVLWSARGQRARADRAAFAGRSDRPFLAFALLSAVLNGLAWVAYFVAFTRGPLAIVQTVTAGYTAVAAVLAVIFLRERLAGVQAAGVALVLAAGTLLAYAEEGAATGGLGGWLPASLAAVVLWGANAVVARYAYTRPGADNPRFFMMHGLGLALTILPYGVWLAPGGSPASAGGLGTVLVVLLYVAGDLGIYGAIARGPASIVNPLLGLYPIPSIAYAALVIGDRPTALCWVGIVLALSGIVLVVPRK